jgi:hypothetical protein
MILVHRRRVVIPDLIAQPKIPYSDKKAVHYDSAVGIARVIGIASRLLQIDVPILVDLERPTFSLSF